MNLNTNTIKYDIKEIVSNNNMAILSHVIAGVLYYEVETLTGSKYMFYVDMNDKDDVGTTTFPAKLKAITLMRYIIKCNSNGSLIKVK